MTTPTTDGRMSTARPGRRCRTRSMWNTQTAITRPPANARCQMKYIHGADCIPPSRGSWPPKPPGKNSGKDSRSTAT